MNFHIYILNINISIDMKANYLKFALVTLRIYVQGTQSQNCNTGFSSHFIKYSKNVKKTSR